MDAIILAGGFGTRLRPLTLKTPKPMVPVANAPFLATLLRRLAQAGVRRVALSAFHQAGELRAACRGLSRWGVAVRVVEEPSPLGTGGAIRYAWIDPAKPTLVLNGDALSDFDFRALLRGHARARAQASLWVRPVDDVSRFGVVEHDARGRVTRFVEKPKEGETDGRDINAGAYLLEPAVRRLIPEGRAVSIERETFPACLAAGLTVHACADQPRAYWRDIGNPADYLAANMDAVDGVLPLYQRGAGAPWPKPDRRKALLAAHCRVHKAGRVERSVLGERCTVAEGAAVQGSVLWAGCRIGKGARVEGAVLGRGVEVGEAAVVRPGSVLGDGAVVPAYSIV